MGYLTTSSSDLQSSIDQLKACVIDRRSDNIRYRQNELYGLYVDLQSHWDELCSAVRRDTSCSTEEAELECYLALDAVRQSYEGVDFEKSLKDEYLVKTGSDFLNKRAPHGLLIILPTTHTRLYSILTTVAAAKAAGNCVLLQLTSDASRENVDRLLSNIFSKNLDRDAFSISRSALPQNILDQADLVVDQKGQGSTNTPSKFLQTQQSEAIAFIDRSANVENAAKLLVDARVKAYRSSPYSPMIVVANTFIAEDVGRDCLIYSAQTSLSTAVGSGKLSQEETEASALIHEAERKGTVKVHSTPRTVLQIVEILDRDSSLLKRNLKGPFIFIVGATSMTDMVNLTSTTKLRVAYVFGSLPVCKLVSEQISTEVAFINQLPTPLLHGPGGSSQMFSQHPRYTAEMFSTATPQVVSNLCEIPKQSEIRKVVMRKLRATGQKQGFAIGFFEQGILIGLGTVLLVLLSTTGYSSWYLGRRMGWWGSR